MPPAIDVADTARLHQLEVNLSLLVGDQHSLRDWRAFWAYFAVAGPYATETVNRHYVIAITRWRRRLAASHDSAGDDPFPAYSR